MIAPGVPCARVNTAQDASGAALPAGSRKRTRVPTVASSSQIDPPSGYSG